MSDSAILGVVLAVVALVIIVIILAASLYIVKTNQVAVIERFGKFHRMAKAGINVRIPIVDTIANRMSLRIQQMDRVISTITNDKVTVDLDVSVQYRVATSERTPSRSDGSADNREDSNLYRANYALTDVDEQIASYIFDAVRSTVPSKTLDDVFAEKDRIASEVNEQLSTTMQEYGYEIVRTLVTGVRPDGEVEAAMNRINAAERMRDAATAEAEAYKIGVIGKAQGDSEAKRLSGEGIAMQRRAIAEGLAEQRRVLQEAGVVNAEEVMLANQYFDTMLGVAGAGNTTTVFLPGGADGVGLIGEQIRTSILTAKAADGSVGSVSSVGVAGAAGPAGSIRTDSSTGITPKH